MDGLDWMLVGGLIVPLVFHAVLLAHTGSDEGPGMGLLALCAGGCLIGFAYWNRPAAVLFMGDGGSLFLGALSAATILQVSLTFGVIIAVTPFLYFLMDTSSTIMLRLAAGDNIFHAHSQHAYQFAFRNGRSAVRITVAVAVLNLGLAALGILMLMSTDWAVYCLFAFACLITGLFSLRLRQYPDQRRPA